VRPVWSAAPSYPWCDQIAWNGMLACGSDCTVSTDRIKQGQQTHYGPKERTCQNWNDHPETLQKQEFLMSE
jgi:hypothetical protein